MKKKLMIENKMLFNLQPLKNLPGLQEHFASLLARLARAHGLSLSALLSVIMLHIGDTNASKLLRRGCSRIYVRGTSFIGAGTFTRKLISATEELSGMTGLGLHTLLPIQNIATIHSLKKYKSFCPECLRDARLEQTAVIEPLLWQIRGVYACPIHKSLLLDRCSDCDNTMPLTTRMARSGYCTVCGRFLGSSAVRVFAAGSRALWLSEQARLLLSKFPVIAGCLSRDRIRDAINEHIASAYGNNSAAFARAVRLPKATVEHWGSGYAFPSLMNLLNVSYELDIPLIDLIAGTHIESGQIQLDLFAINHASVSRRLSSSVDPIQLILSFSKASASSPVASVTKLAGDLGVTVSTLRKHLPIACRSASARHLQHIAQTRELRFQELLSKVVSAAKSLSAQGTEPTLHQIELFLNKPKLFAEIRLKNAVSKTLQDTNILPLFAQGEDHRKT